MIFPKYHWYLSEVLNNSLIIFFNNKIAKFLIKKYIYSHEKLNTTPLDPYKIFTHSQQIIKQTLVSESGPAHQRLRAGDLAGARFSNSNFVRVRASVSRSLFAHADGPRRFGARKPRKLIEKTRQLFKNLSSQYPRVCIVVWVCVWCQTVRENTRARKFLTPAFHVWIFFEFLEIWIRKWVTGTV